MVSTSSSIAPATRLRDGGAAQASAKAATRTPPDSISRRCCAVNAMLMPMPITTCAGPPASARNSSSTPPILRSRYQMSFGHFTASSAAPTRASARATATPTARLNAGKSRPVSRKLQLSDSASPPPKGASHARPRRPLPPVCSSVRQASASPKGGAAIDNKRVLVESISKGSSSVRSTCRRAAASSPRMRCAFSSSTASVSA